MAIFQLALTIRGGQKFPPKLTFTGIQKDIVQYGQGSRRREKQGTLQEVGKF